MTTVLNKIAVSFVFLSVMSAPTHAVAASTDPLKAQREAKGYIFVGNHDEIVNMAKKEGKLRVMTGLAAANFKPWINAFKQNYPFMTDVQLEEIKGTDAYQRIALEIKVGEAKEWDIAHIPVDFADAYIPYLMKYDILRMAKNGVLKIDPRMIHPSERNIVTVTSSLSVITYNKKLTSEDKVPVKWEDFLKPEFKGKKFVLDLRPLVVASLVPAWGLERTLDFARKLAAQQPVWGARTATAVNIAIAGGENSLYVASTFSAAKRAMEKDPTGSLSYRFIEPVPARIVEHPSGILNTAAHPHAALLWLEFLASPESQKIIDEYEPFKASVYAPGSVTEQVARGKKLSVVDWDHFTKFREYNEKVFAAYGLPKADK